MNDSEKRPEIPLGLGMALAQNADAMKRFSDLTPDMQRSIIERTHAIRSRKEMSSFVDSMFKN